MSIEWCISVELRAKNRAEIAKMHCNTVLRDIGFNSCDNDDRVYLSDTDITAA